MTDSDLCPRGPSGILFKQTPLPSLNVMNLKNLSALVNLFTSTFLTDSQNQAGQGSCVVPRLNDPQKYQASKSVSKLSGPVINEPVEEVEALVMKKKEFYKSPAYLDELLFVRDTEQSKYHDLIKELQKDSDFDINKRRFERQGDTYLLEAVKKGIYSAVEDIVHAGANVNQLDASNHDSLYYALTGNSRRLAEFLIKKGAMVERENFSPLCEAARQNMPKVAKMLLERGADPQRIDPVSGKTFVQLCKELDRKWGDEVIEQAKNGGLTRQEMLDLVGDFEVHVLFDSSPSFKDDFLELKKQVPTITIDRLYRNAKRPSCLMLAAEGNNIKAINDFLDLGANINLKDSNGHDALTIAIQNGNLQAVDALIKRGADLDRTDINPLCEAVRGKKLEIAKLLIQKGANPNIRENGYKSAADLAAESKLSWF